MSNHIVNRNPAVINPDIEGEAPDKKTKFFIFKVRIYLPLYCKYDEKYHKNVSISLNRPQDPSKQRIYYTYTDNGKDKNCYVGGSSIAFSPVIKYTIIKDPSIVDEKIQIPVRYVILGYDASDYKYVFDITSKYPVGYYDLTVKIIVLMNIVNGYEHNV